MLFMNNEQLLPFPTPCFKMFLERSLNHPTPHHPTSSILHCYPLPIHHIFPLKILIIRPLPGRIIEIAGDQRRGIKIMTHPQGFRRKFTPICWFLAQKTHPFWPHIPSMTQYGSAPPPGQVMQVYESFNSKPDHRPVDPQGFVHSCCPWGRVFAALSCPGVCPAGGA